MVDGGFVVGQGTESLAVLRKLMPNRTSLKHGRDSRAWGVAGVSISIVAAETILHKPVGAVVDMRSNEHVAPEFPEYYKDVKNVKRNFYNFRLERLRRRAGTIHSAGRRNGRMKRVWLRSANLP